MKRGGIGTVFGLPTLLTVLIVMSVLGFASLSVMTTAAQHRGMERSLDLLERTSDILEQAQTQHLTLSASLSDALEALSPGVDQSLQIAAWAQANALVYVTESSTISVTITNSTMAVTTVLWISPTHIADNVRLVSQTLRIINDQDYTQDGDPIWKGPQ
jgi:type II secretory pathway pseudopilin PulG